MTDQEDPRQRAVLADMRRHTAAQERQRELEAEPARYGDELTAVDRAEIARLTEGTPVDPEVQRLADLANGGSAPADAEAQRILDDYL